MPGAASADLGRAHEDFFRAAPCFLTVQDRDLRIVSANENFTATFGEGIGRHCFQVYKRRESKCPDCPVAMTFHDGQSHHSEEVVTSRSGEQIHTLVSTAPIKNAAGEIELVVEMSANITEIRKLQGQLANLGLLVGSISHGIKGLLTGLDGGMYLMSSGFDMNKSERIQEGWHMVRRNVGQIRNVVLDLLHIAKEREPSWELVEVRDLARNVVRTLKKKAEDLQIRFETDLARDAGQCELDVKSFQAALINILENALDACRVDHRKAEHMVRLRLFADAEDAVFEIEDNGIGMDRETREKMFSLFFSSKGTEGTGLGLFTANKVVEKHHGRIDVESRPGEGTRFTVRIPRANRVPATTETPANLSSNPADPPS